MKRRRARRDPSLSPALRELFERSLRRALEPGRRFAWPDRALSNVLWDATIEKTGPLRLVHHGYAARGARSLGLTKIPYASAEKVYNAGLPVVLVGSKVNTSHFFGGWYLAYVQWPEEGVSFESRYSLYDAYLDPELGKPTTFLFGLPPPKRSS